jgi:hypothetical protein
MLRGAVVPGVLALLSPSSRQGMFVRRFGRVNDVTNSHRRIVVTLPPDNLPAPG